MSKLTKTDALAMATKNPAMRALNPHVAEAHAARKAGKKRGAMNKTEAAFARQLDLRVSLGELVSFDYEGMTLRWGPDGMRYTPDFCAVKSLCSEDGVSQHVRLVFFEVKGGFIRPQDLVKFKAARANWPLFEFQLWQLKQREWRQII